HYCWECVSPFEPRRRGGRQRATMIRNTAGTILLAATVTAAALTQATHVRAAGKYDGNWSVAVYTRSGPCDAAYRFSGQIVNGVIVYNGGGGCGHLSVAAAARP